MDFSGTPENVRSLQYRGVHTHTHDALGNECKFLGVLESVRQEERMSLECSAKRFFRRMSIIK